MSITRPDNKLMETRRRNLIKAVNYHGHLCLGQLLGVHLAEKGLEAIQTGDPKKMIVYVENDRCIADAIQILTGTRLGRRSMKLVNYGKMAATFINTETWDAYRISVSGKINEIIGQISSDPKEKERQYQILLEAPSEDVVTIQKVVMNIAREEMPGKPLRTVTCVKCNEKVMDCKDVPGADGPLCLACAGKPYYQLAVNNTDETGK